MGYRRGQLATDKAYHIFTKSIAKFIIFNDQAEFTRMQKATTYYQLAKPILRLSWFLDSAKEKAGPLWNRAQENGRLVEIIAYCIMPTHLHFVLKQIEEDGISTFMNNVLNSYTRYFNNRHKRKGPLWEGRFKDVLVKTDEQLLHLTRYIHLNPVTAYLVNKPEDWPASSYREYLSEVNGNSSICKYDDILCIDPDSYRGFVEDRISYQRELGKIKDLLIDEESTVSTPRRCGSGF